MCYHAKFGRDATKGVCINRREPQNSGALGHRPLAVGAWLIPKIRSFLTSVILLNSVAERRGARDEAARASLCRGWHLMNENLEFWRSHCNVLALV